MALASLTRRAGRAVALQAAKIKPHMPVGQPHISPCFRGIFGSLNGTFSLGKGQDAGREARLHKQYSRELF